MTFEVITGFALYDLSNAVINLGIYYTDSSTNLTTQADFEEINWGRMKNDFNDTSEPFFTIQIKKEDINIFSREIKSLFTNYYNYTCPLRNDIAVDFLNPIINETVYSRDGSETSWENTSDLTGNVTITNIPVTYSDGGTSTYTIYAHDTDGLEAALHL